MYNLLTHQEIYWWNLIKCKIDFRDRETTAAKESGFSANSRSDETL